MQQEQDTKGKHFDFTTLSLKESQRSGKAFGHIPATGTEEGGVVPCENALPPPPPWKSLEARFQAFVLRK